MDTSFLRASEDHLYLTQDYIKFFQDIVKLKTPLDLQKQI